MLEMEDVSELDLPPEIIRRLQVEELWARRGVLAELMNAERLKSYNRRRAELWPANFPSVDVTWKEVPLRPVASILPIKAKASLVPGC